LVEWVGADKAYKVADRLADRVTLVADRYTEAAPAEQAVDIGTVEVAPVADISVEVEAVQAADK